MVLLLTTNHKYGESYETQITKTYSSDKVIFLKIKKQTGKKKC